MSGKRKDIARTQTTMHAGKISAPSPKYYAKGPVDVVAHECELSEVCILSVIISIVNGFIILSRQAVWIKAVCLSVCLSGDTRT